MEITPFLVVVIAELALPFFPAVDMIDQKVKVHRALPKWVVGEVDEPRSGGRGDQFPEWGYRGGLATTD